MSTDTDNINELCARDAESRPEPTPTESPDSFWFDIRVPLWKYVVRMWLIGFVPSILVAVILLASGALTDQSGPDFGSGKAPAIVVFIGIVVVSPFVETLLMGIVFKLLSLVTRRRYTLAVMSCLLWAGVHSLASPLWGVAVFWPFFVFSCSYLAWRRVSWWRAVLVTTLVHTLQNLPAGAVVVLSGG